jgi:hypothetical protein
MSQLPALPPPDYFGYDSDGIDCLESYSGDAMREYAALAVAAERERIVFLENKLMEVATLAQCGGWAGLSVNETQNYIRFILRNHWDKSAGKEKTIDLIRKAIKGYP